MSPRATKPLRMRYNESTDKRRRAFYDRNWFLFLDRSGSMSGLEADTIGGFNSMIEKQRRRPGRRWSPRCSPTTARSSTTACCWAKCRPDGKGISPAAARRCWMPWAAPSTTSATSISTPVGRTCRKRRCSLSPPTATKTPAAATITSVCAA